MRTPSAPPLCYDCVELAFTRDASGVSVAMTERETLPTAAEIEHNYNHDRHPNPLVEAAETQAAPKNRNLGNAPENKGG